MRITFLILTIVMLSPGVGYAFGFDEDCEDQPFQPTTGCDFPDEPDGGSPGPSPMPPAPDSPPATPPSTLPPNQIATFAQGMSQLTLLTDFYLQQTLEDLTGSSVSMTAILPSLAAQAAAESTPSGAAELASNVEFFLFKLRILNAHNSLFSNSSAYPSQFSLLLNRVVVLNIEESGLELRQ